MNHVQGSTVQQAKAFAWEFWAHGWRGQLLAIAGVVGFASVLYGSIFWESDILFRGTVAGVTMHFGLYWVTLIFLGAPILVAWGDPQRRYTLPTSSFVAVACPMICSMVSMFVGYAMAATMVNMLFDAGWPIWGPGLAAALSIAWFQAILWSTSNSQGLCLASCLASLGVLSIGVGKFVSPGDSAMAWFQGGIHASHVLMFGLASLVCVGVGTVGFASLRYGGGIDVDRIVAWVSRLFPKTVRSTPFSSPSSAQFWLEWTERGYIMPAGTVLVGVVTLLLACFVRLEDPVDLAGGISMMLLTPALVIGIFLGGRSENGEFGNFNGSRPLSDGQVGNAVLASATVGVLSSVLIWAAFIAATLLVLGHRTDLSTLVGRIEQVGPIRMLGYAFLGAGVIWSAVGLMTSMVLAGKKVSAVGMCTVFGVLITGLVAPRFVLSIDAQAAFLHVFVFACVALTLICITAGFVAGWWLQLISPSTFVLAAGIAGAMLAAAYLSGFTSERQILLPVLSGCCTIPFPLAAAPLAVWWNRHR